MKYPEQASSREQKIHGCQGPRGVAASWARAFWGDEDTLQLDSDDGCTTLGMCQMSATKPFTLHEFYYKKKKSQSTGLEPPSHFLLTRKLRSEKNELVRSPSLLGSSHAADLLPRRGGLLLFNTADSGTRKGLRREPPRSFCSRGPCLPRRGPPCPTRRARLAFLLAPFRASCLQVCW